MYYTFHENIKQKYFEELSKLPTHLRQATIFKYYVNEIPLHIFDNDLIAGFYGFIDNHETVLNKNQFVKKSVLSEYENELTENLLKNHLIDIKFEPAHTCINYGDVIKNGLGFYIELIEDKLKLNPNNEFYLAMKDSLLSALHFASRYLKLVEKELLNTNDENKKKRLIKIKNTLLNVPYNGAKNFHEAVQFLWLIHQLIPISEMVWYSISIGRIDQFLYSYYINDIKNGVSRDEQKNILKNLFVLLNSYGDGACAVNIGGVDNNCKDMYNELSKLIIEVEKECSLSAPIIAARISEYTPKEIYDSLIDFDLFKIGQPTFYGELSCKNAMVNRGLSIKDASNFAINSCMGLIIPGSEFANMWGIKFNMHLPLEMALNNGKPFHNEMIYESSVDFYNVTTEDELIDLYAKYLSELMEMSSNISYKKAIEASLNSSNPFLSIFIDGCIENGLDRSIGAKYNTVTVECMAMVNTCDAIEAICHLVFDLKKYTISDIIDATKNNFVNYDQLLYDIRKCHKYGMNDSRCNRIISKISGIMAQICKNNSHDNYMFIPSLHTIDDNVWYGARLNATCDGRLNYEPICKNANPSSLINSIVPTSLILSASSVQQCNFSGGQPIDLYFSKNQLFSKESKDKIKCLINTYFQLGGLQIQVNSVDIDLLEKAYLNPDKYPDLIIRKGGYSVRFNELSKKIQKDFIELSKKTEML